MKSDVVSAAIEVIFTGDAKGRPVRISELSERSGVSITSIKYYLREGLLASGVRTATTQAVYGEQHLRRLRLVRALIDIGGLSISHLRAAMAAVDGNSTSMHDTFGAVMHGLYDVHTGEDEADALAAYDEVQAWLATRGWTVGQNAPAQHRLAEAVATLRRFDFAVALTDFDDAADNVERTADSEVRYARAQDDRTEYVERMLIGTVILERAIVEVRRLGLEAASFKVENAYRNPQSGG